MKYTTSLFSQILQIVPRSMFLQLVHQRRAERHAKGFSCWSQYVAMLFCQLAQAKSLREISDGLAVTCGKLSHLGLSTAPAKSTLAYANAHRPWKLYQDTFFKLLDFCRYESPGKKKKFRFRNKLLSLDSTTIDLCLSLFPWADFRQTKGAVKLHLLLDHDGYLPSFAVKFLEHLLRRYILHYLHHFRRRISGWHLYKRCTCSSITSMVSLQNPYTSAIF